MNWKRILTLVAIAGGLAALVTSAATTGRVRIAPPLGESAQTKAAEASGAELAAEIARLRDRLHPTALPQQPPRNLFRFHSAPASHAAAPLPAAQPVVDTVVAVPAAPPPALKLIGIAADSDASGAILTAIISGPGDLFLVKEGESITPRYRVNRITSDAVEIIDLTDAVTIRLAFK